MIRIFTVEKLGNIFNQVSIPLKYTPRKFALHKPSRTFVIIESDHATYSPEAKAQGIAEKEQEGFEIDPDITDLDPAQFGNVRNGSGKWASCIRLVEPFAGNTLQTIELEENEAAFSVAIVQFRNNPHATDAAESFIVVGTGQNVVLQPRSCTAGYLRVYRVVQGEDGQLRMDFIHRTPVDDVPHALLAFQGRLLVGAGKALRIYDIGKKKMLRKCETKTLPNCIVSLHTQGHRVVATDIQESVHYVIYKHVDNRLVVFADDTIPRWMTASTMVDYETVAGGDKFGNFFVNRLPESVSREVDEDTTGNRIYHEKGYLQGAPNKVWFFCNML